MLSYQHLKSEVFRVLAHSHTTTILGADLQYLLLAHQQNAKIFKDASHSGPPNRQFRRAPNHASRPQDHRHTLQQAFRP